MNWDQSAPKPTAGAAPWTSYAGYSGANHPQHASAHTPSPPPYQVSPPPPYPTSVSAVPRHPPPPPLVQHGLLRRDTAGPTTVQGVPVQRISPPLAMPSWVGGSQPTSSHQQVSPPAGQQETGDRALMFGGSRGLATAESAMYGGQVPPNPMANQMTRTGNTVPGQAPFSTNQGPPVQPQGSNMAPQATQFQPPQQLQQHRLPHTQLTRQQGPAMYPARQQIPNQGGQIYSQQSILQQQQQQQQFQLLKQQQKQKLYQQQLQKYLFKQQEMPGQQGPQHQYPALQAFQQQQQQQQQRKQQQQQQQLQQQQQQRQHIIQQKQQQHKQQQIGVSDMNQSVPSSVNRSQQVQAPMFSESQTSNRMGSHTHTQQSQLRQQLLKQYTKQQLLEKQRLIFQKQQKRGSGNITGGTQPQFPVVSDDSHYATSQQASKQLPEATYVMGHQGQTGHPRPGLSLPGSVHGMQGPPLTHIGQQSVPNGVPAPQPRQVNISQQFMPTMEHPQSISTSSRTVDPDAAAQIKSAFAIPRDSERSGIQGHWFKLPENDSSSSTSTSVAVSQCHESYNQSTPSTENDISNHSELQTVHQTKNLDKNGNDQHSSTDTDGIRSRHNSGMEPLKTNRQPEVQVNISVPSMPSRPPSVVTSRSHHSSGHDSNDGMLHDAPNGTEHQVLHPKLANTDSISPEDSQQHIDIFDAMLTNKLHELAQLQHVSQLDETEIPENQLAVNVNENSIAHRTGHGVDIASSSKTVDNLVVSDMTVVDVQPAQANTLVDKSVSKIVDTETSTSTQYAQTRTASTETAANIRLPVHWKKNITKTALNDTQNGPGISNTVDDSQSTGNATDDPYSYSSVGKRRSFDRSDDENDKDYQPYSKQLKRGSGRERAARGRGRGSKGNGVNSVSSSQGRGKSVDRRRGNGNVRVRGRGGGRGVSQDVLISDDITKLDLNHEAVNKKTYSISAEAPKDVWDKPKELSNANTVPADIAIGPVKNANLDSPLSSANTTSAIPAITETVEGHVSETASNANMEETHVTDNPVDETGVQNTLCSREKKSLDSTIANNETIAPPLEQMFKVEKELSDNNIDKVELLSDNGFHILISDTHFSKVRFHGRVILLLTNPRGIFFIFKEVIKRCFRPRNHNEYRSIVRLKAITLKMTYIKLDSSLEEFVTDNLIKRNILKEVPKDPLGIITLNNTKMLYHSYMGKKHCIDQNIPCVKLVTTESQVEAQPSTNRTSDSDAASNTDSDHSNVVDPSMDTMFTGSKTQSITDSPFSTPTKTPPKRNKSCTSDKRDRNIFDAIPSVKLASPNKVGKKNKIPVKNSAADTCMSGSDSDGYASDQTVPYVDGVPHNSSSELNDTVADMDMLLHISISSADRSASEQTMETTIKKKVDDSVTRSNDDLNNSKNSSEIRDDSIQITTDKSNNCMNSKPAKIGDLSKNETTKAVTAAKKNVAESSKLSSLVCQGIHNTNNVLDGVEKEMAGPRVCLQTEDSDMQKVASAVQSCSLIDNDKMNSKPSKTVAASSTKNFTCAKTNPIASTSGHHTVDVHDNIAGGRATPASEVGGAGFNLFEAEDAVISPRGQESAQEEDDELKLLKAGEKRLDHLIQLANEATDDADIAYVVCEAEDMEKPLKQLTNLFLDQFEHRLKLEEDILDEKDKKIAREDEIKAAKQELLEWANPIEASLSKMSESERREALAEMAAERAATQDLLDFIQQENDEDLAIQAQAVPVPS